MMKLLTQLLIALYFFNGCASFNSGQLTKDEFDKISYNFGSVNGVIEAVVNESPEHVGVFTLEKYDQALSSMKNDKAKELKEAMSYFDVRELESVGTSFIICIFSRKSKQGLCDFSKCTRTEIKTLTSEEQLKKNLMELKTYACPKEGKTKS